MNENEVNYFLIKKILRKLNFHKFHDRISFINSSNNYH